LTASRVSPPQAATAWSAAASRSSAGAWRPLARTFIDVLSLFKESQAAAAAWLLAAKGIQRRMGGVGTNPVQSS
jgi:hypothetical protein